jgi:hypothetical protein
MGETHMLYTYILGNFMVYNYIKEKAMRGE